MLFCGTKVELLAEKTEFMFYFFSVIVYFNFTYMNTKV